MPYTTHRITNTGSYQISGSFDEVSTPGSIYFSGSDYFTTPAGLTTAMSSGFGGGQYTIECWVYPTSYTPLNGYTMGIIGSYQAVAANGRWVLSVIGSAGSTGNVSFIWTTGTGSQTSVTTTNNSIQLNKWSHIVISMWCVLSNNSSIGIYVNGVNSGSFGGLDFTTQSAYYGPPTIGGNMSIYINNFVGYISNLRIVNGTYQVYTGDFNPNAAAFPLSVYSGSSTALLLKCLPTAPFADSSTNAFSLTAAGSPSASTLSPVPVKQTNTGSVLTSGEFDEVNLPGSLYFDGTGDYVTVPQSSKFTINANQDFTMECWAYLTSLRSDYSFITYFYDGSNILEFRIGNAGFGYRVQGAFGPGASASSVYDNTSYTQNNLLNRWTHLALCRSGTTTKFFFDGIAISTQTGVGSVAIGTPVGGAYLSYVDPYGFPGYISNVKVTVGTALYPNDFTPPTTSLTTSTGTVLLVNNTPLSPLADISTSSFTLTASGNTRYDGLSPFAVMRQTNTGSVKVSNYFDEVSWNGSIYFGGAAYLSVPYTSAFDFGSGDFTVEFWMNSASINTVGIMAFPHNASNYAPVLFYGATATGLTLYSSSNGTSWDVANGVSIGTISANSWNHVAVSKSGSSIRLFLNGSLGNTVTFAGTFSGTYDRIWIGDTASNNNYTGYLSNIRIVKGTALYTGAFTPSSSPLSVVTGTSLLMTTGAFEPFNDASTNNLSITQVGSPAFSSKSPFVPGS